MDIIKEQAATSPVQSIRESMAYGPAPESATTALAWIKDHAPFGHWINGAWVTGSDHFASINPATGKPIAQIAQIAQASTAQVDQAVAAAKAALPGWKSTPGHVRARYLYAIARQIQKNSRLFAVLETLDNGKPIRETRDLDIPLAARHFAYHAGWAQLLDSQFADYAPVGVVGQIIPWNFPLLMLAWKIAPALAAGCTVVLKPAEFTSLTALAFAELCESINLPPGVVNIITGDGRVGEAIVNHPDVDKIAFTGSTEVGKIIRKATAGSGKKLSLELGGKSPFVIFAEADLDSAVEGVVDAIWFNQGQVCCAGSRLIVQESIADQLINKLRARMETLRLGDPLDKAVDMGAIVADVQLQRIAALVAQGVAEGATLYQPSWSCPTDGYWFKPTLLTNVAPASTVAQVEIFGPVAVTQTFRTPAEAIQLANNTRYGLAASVWSEDINIALDTAHQIKAGVVWINCTNMLDAAAGFGGYRESGYGREGGSEGMYEYLKPLPHAPRGFPGVLASEPHPPAPSPQAREGKSTDARVEKGFGGEVNGNHIPPIDRTPKLFIKGKQSRPDSAYSRIIYDGQHIAIGQVGEGNRKDIRNAVEAARAASDSWAESTGYNRAQILYYLAENLSARANEFTARIISMTGASTQDSAAEVAAAIDRLFAYGAWADKYDGAVHGTPLHGLTLAVREPIGVLGVICPDSAPLLGLIALIAPAIAMANAVVVVPSERWPLSATDFYQVLETSDVPAGVVNIVTGGRETLIKTLADHDDVDALWIFGEVSDPKSADQARAVEQASIGNLKRTLVGTWPESLGWPDTEFLRHAVQVKNIWTPYGA